MRMLDKTLVIMFVKDPQLGFVKSRLAEHTSDEFALILSQFFVHDLIYTLQGGNHDFKLCVCGDLDHASKTFGKYDNFLQKNGDLGEKMQHAFEEMFEKGYDKIIIMGSDIPHLNNATINQSFEELKTNDIVLGSRKDGGYYLIGFNKQTFMKNVFENIEWSSPKVTKQILQKFHKKNTYLAKELNNIATLEELKDFFEQHHKGSFKNSYTIEFLKESKEQWEKA